MIRTTLLAAALSAVTASAVLAQAAPAPGSAPGASDWRTPNADDVLVIDTNKGRIVVEIVPEAAPNHATRIRELTKAGFYNGLTFFRVIDGFMDQTGDPKNNGTGNSDKPDLAAEFSFRKGPETAFVLADDQAVAEHGFVKSLGVKTQSSRLALLTKDGKVAAQGLFCPGVAAMARGDDPNSANSQFFLMRDVYPRLDGRYTPWGRVISGQDVVTKIKVGEPVADPQDKMTEVRLLSDIPAAQRPKVRVIDPAGPWFKAQIAKAKAEKGAAFTACDVKITAEVN